MAQLAFDWFRNQNGDSGILRRNVAWLHHYFSQTGLFDHNLERLNGFAGRAEEVFQRLEMVQNQYSWAHLYDKLEDFPLAAEFFLETCGASDLVVGYELSRAQMRLLNAQGRIYVNLRAHPIRFLPDYHLALRTNSPEIQARAETLAPSRGYIDLNVAFHKARAARRYVKRLNPEEGCVFFAQTSFDSSRIRKGEFLDDAFLLAELSEYARREGIHNKYYKPHPHEKPPPAFEKGLKLQQWRPIGTETYDLMSVEGLRLCALSSSIGHEARYFGARPTGFFQPDERFPLIGEASAPGDYVMTPANIHSAEIWRYLLEGGEKPAAEYPQHQTPFRVSSGLSWG